MQCCYGNFSAAKMHEVLVSRGKLIELMRPDDTGRMVSVCAQECFGVIRAMVPFRLTGATKDYICIGSDSGRIVVIEYDDDRNQFVKIHQETFGKSGCRRIVPGQYMAADPKGRAVMISAAEKQKLVYILNRDSAARLTISSPLEGHSLFAPSLSTARFLLIICRTLAAQCWLLNIDDPAHSLLICSLFAHYSLRSTQSNTCHL